jgi:4-coumarate--CoA ligase
MIAVDKYDMSSLSVMFCAAAPLAADLGKQVSSLILLHSPVISWSPQGHKPFSGEKGERKILYSPRLASTCILPVLSGPLCTGYGLSEMSPTTHLLAREDGDRKFGSVGILLPNIEARLVVDGDGPGDIDAKDGEPGELWARGPGAMKVRFRARHL